MMSEISLFDSLGKPVAYIATDEENTIYSWDGVPTAYVDGEDVYGFNGRHLGWFEEGIVWNHNGAQVGFLNHTLPVFAQFEPFKAFKQFKPFKAFKEFAPFKPFQQQRASQTPLAIYLASGR
jgi:hypothetical protein